MKTETFVVAALCVFCFALLIAGGVIGTLIYE